MIDLVQTPAQRAVVDRLTALMTLVEGHAEFVMDGVGPEVVPSVAAIREKFNARRVARNPIEKALRRLLGVEVKMRQYAEGRRFVGRRGRRGRHGRLQQDLDARPRPCRAPRNCVTRRAWIARVQPASVPPLPASARAGRPEACIAGAAWRGRRRR